MNTTMTMCAYADNKWSLWFSWEERYLPLSILTVICKWKTYNKAANVVNQNTDIAVYKKISIIRTLYITHSYLSGKCIDTAVNNVIQANEQFISNQVITIEKLDID